MNYEKDLEIDKNSLDNEWLQQSSRYMKYAKESAEAQTKVNRAKENMEVVYAEQFSIEKSAAEKVTDKTADSEVRTSKEYQEATKEYAGAVEHSNIMRAAVEAMNQRKYALENLVKLYLAGYFSEPREERSDDTTSTKDKAIENGSSKQNKKLNKNRRSKNAKKESK